MNTFTDRILDFIKQTAVHAGRSIIMPSFASGNINVSYKSNTDLLTDIDRRCEDFIVSEIRQNFPDHSIVAEEGGGSEERGGYVWYIDPIDGTNNFAHGVAHFSVSIALYSEQGEAIAAGVYNPSLNELFYAAKGNGAYCNETRVSVSAVENIEMAMLFTGFPYDKSDPEYTNVDQVAAIIPKVQALRRFGAASLDLCAVAAGRCDGFWEPFLKPWDIAAGILIVKEAGGTVSDYRGNPIGPVTHECVATNGSIHRTLLNLLCGATVKYPSERTCK